MKKTLKTIIFIILMFVLIAILNAVNAATASITANSEANVGNVIIKANVTATQWNLKLSVNGTEIATSSELENYEKNLTKTFQGTYNAKSTGNITVTLTGDITDADNTNTVVNQTKTINIKEATVAEPNFTTVNQTVYAKSETNVRASYSTSSQSYGMLAVGDSVTRIGIGDNGWSKVTYNGKTAYIYSNNLTTTKQEEAKSTDKALKSLKITEGTLEPEFNPETTKYSVTVPNNVEQAKIEALANDEKATVTITGNEKLIIGSNMVKITVTAEDGTTRIYNLEVVKTNKEPAQLTKLEIPGITLNPEFKSDVYQYTIQLESGSTVTDFAIQTETNSTDATVEIIGNSNLKEGENVITILVTSADGTEKSSYQIIVNKPATASENLFTGENGKTNIALIAIGVLIVVAVIIVVIAIIKKRRAEEEYDDDEPDPYRPSFNDDDLDTDEDAKKEDFTGVYKHQILDDDEMEQRNTIQQTGRFQTTSMEIEEKLDNAKIQDDEDYVPDTKQEKNIDNTMEMTRRYSTNYDYTLEQYKKPKNTGKGKHF